MFERREAAGTGRNRAVVDVGNPLMGILLGVLLIAGTMAALFLWQSHQDGAVAEPVVVTAQSR
jgi:hypothetical protein